MSEIVNSPSVVNEKEKRSLSHSTFPLVRRYSTTEQFGYVKPHICIEGKSTESFKARTSFATESYTLKAPLKQDVLRYLTYIKVDMSAILPFNFEKFFVNPVVGDDVPSDVACVVDNFYFKLFSFIDAVRRPIQTAYNNNTVDWTTFTSFVRWLLLCECFYSRGCLLSSLGCHLASQVEFTTNRTEFDAFLDRQVVEYIIPNIPSSGFLVTIDGVVYHVAKSFVNSFDSEGRQYLTFRDVLVRLRSTSDFVFDGIDSDCPANFVYLSKADINFIGGSEAPFNFSRCAAYQLSIAEFMTNDHVDNIYNAELYRQYIGSLLIDTTIVDDPVFFTFNGTHYQYDWLSGKYLDELLDTDNVSYFLNFNLGKPFLQYFLSLFSFARSLRYKDYFVSSRIHPLAVGDVSVAVQDNSVSVVDVTRRVQVQRFLNRVNHIGRNISNYIRGIFGADLEPDRHIPKFLAVLGEKVYTALVENTGAEQFERNQSLTARFTGNSSHKELEFYCDFPCIIIGLTSYDIERSYIDTIDRDFFIKDRFDMFVPELQFVGDQPVYRGELNANAAQMLSPFGYQYRDMQWKLLYNVADGGFVNNLPGYAFIYSNRRNININSDFIRSLPSELDNFYLSLTGYSLGSYFHFISVIDNEITASRPMIANPKILE